MYNISEINFRFQELYLFINLNFLHLFHLLPLHLYQKSFHLLL